MSKDPKGGVPCYGFEGLLQLLGWANLKMLRQDRKQPAEGQKPVAQYWSGHDFVLVYKVDEAADMPPLSPGRQAQWDRNRTCASCGGKRKDPLPQRRDGRRFCGVCMKQACQQLWDDERAEDRKLVAAWAAGVVATDDVLLVGYSRRQWVTRVRVEGGAGDVLFDQRIRYGDSDHIPQAERDTSVLYTEVDDQLAAFAGRRVIAWDDWETPRFTRTDGQADVLVPVREDHFSGWNSRWVGECDQVLVPHPRLRYQPKPAGDPEAVIDFMRGRLLEMAAAHQPFPVTQVSPAELAEDLAVLDRANARAREADEGRADDGAPVTGDVS